MFLITQSRTTNIPLYLLFLIQSTLLARLSLSPLQITISSFLLGHTAFFALGNSNAISSIDLSNAYNGVSGYNVLAVGILVFLSNWAGPVWWSIAGVKLLIQSQANPEVNDKGKNRRDWVKAEMDNLLPAESKSQRHEAYGKSEEGGVFFTHITLLTLFTSASLLAVMVACTVLRTHLFIWTVFSPKYLYAMAWSLAFHLIISVGFGSGFWWFCTR